MVLHSTGVQPKNGNTGVPVWRFPPNLQCVHLYRHGGYQPSGNSNLVYRAFYDASSHAIKKDSKHSSHHISQRSLQSSTLCPEHLDALEEQVIALELACTFHAENEVILDPPQLHLSLKLLMP